MRTHTCGQLRAADIGKVVTLCGWVANHRDHGGLIFVDLRDRYGLTQVAFDPSISHAAHDLAETVRSEWTIRVTGKVRPRPEGMLNPKMETGEIEVEATELTVLSQSETPPFDIGGGSDTSEDTRLKYRYLDLRRAPMQKALITRSKIVHLMREFYDAEGFVDVETPFLTKSTPEGARDFLVPSRVNPGRFFALPQSPQLFKQILMVAGFDRYYQVVRCMRDEDLRADRQPEFTQLDVEMSYVQMDDVIGTTERMLSRVMKEILGLEITLPIPRMTYDYALSHYGTDAPDVRFEMHLVDVTDLAATTDFRVFRDAIAAGGKVRGLCVKGGATISRKEIDELTTFVTDLGAKGLAWTKIEEAGFNGGVAKFFDGERGTKLREAFGATAGDLVMFVADQSPLVYKCLAQLRNLLGRKLGLVKPGTYGLTWVVDFPMFEYDPEEKRYVAIHHPFTAPKDEDLDRLESDAGRAVQGLRHRAQRHRTGRRQHPYPPAGRAEPRVFAAGHPGGRGPSEVRLPAGRVEVRRAAARRHRPRTGPLRHAPAGSAEHSRHDCLPEDAEGDVLDDPGARPGGRATTEGTQHPPDRGRPRGSGRRSRGIRRASDEPSFPRSRPAGAPRPGPDGRRVRQHGFAGGAAESGHSGHRRSGGRPHGGRRRAGRPQLPGADAFAVAAGNRHVAAPVGIPAGVLAKGRSHGRRPGGDRRPHRAAHGQGTAGFRARANHGRGDRASRAAQHPQRRQRHERH